MAEAASAASYVPDAASATTPNHPWNAQEYQHPYDTPATTTRSSGSSSRSGNYPSRRQTPPLHHPASQQRPPSSTSSSNSEDHHHHHQQQGRRSLQTTVDNAKSAAGRLRAVLMTDYDRNAFPWEYVWEQNINSTNSSTVDNGDDEDDNGRTGLDVALGLNFHKVHQLHVAESTADLVVWVRITWNDPRLRWDPTEHSGLTKVWFWIEQGMGGNEASEIWTPDIYLWNQEEPMHTTLADAYATVRHTGDVFWSRPGRIKSTCKYKGLDKFPFDNLECQMEFGSWAHSGLYIRPTKLDGIGYSIGGSDTAGQSFSEFDLAGVECNRVIYPPFPNSPEEDWPVIIYDLTFDRAQEPYVRGYVLLQIFLNMCAFACFWIPPHVGERLGLAITSLLAAVASELTVSARLPAAGEFTWFVVFSMVSMLFSVSVVFQSSAVIYFYYYTGSDLVPTYVKSARRKWRMYRGKQRLSQQRMKNEEAASSGFRQSKNTENETGEGTQSVNMDKTKHANNSGTKPSNLTLQNKIVESGGRVHFGADAKYFESAKNGSPFSGHSENDQQSQVSELDDSHQASVSDVVRGDDGAPFKAFNGEPSRRDRSLSLTQNDIFTVLSHSSKTLTGRRDADDFENEQERQNNNRWRKVAFAIDEYSRPIFVVAYSIFLAIVFARRGDYPNDNPYFSTEDIHPQQ